MLMPDKFIDLAEKTGLIIPIGEWVLNEACRQMREWYVLGYTDWRIAVNLSALQFCHAGSGAAWPRRWPLTICRPTA
jgi:EAL domain-containing protein (putative c-di-GMP-specific phosphodiesterase class I)